MPTNLQPRCLEIEQVGDATIIRFTCRTILEDELIAVIGSQLSSSVDDAERPHLVLDFRNVESVSTMMVSKLVGLHKKVQAAGGQLALCNVRPFLHEIFKLFKLPQLLKIYEEEQEALQAF